MSKIIKITSILVMLGMASIMLASVVIAEEMTDKESRLAIRESVIRGDAPDVKKAIEEAKANRLNRAGAFSKTFGTAGQDSGNKAMQTSDGGYIMVGTTYGANGADILLVKTDKRGNKLWEFSFGGPDNEYANSVIETPDGEYILAGYIQSASNYREKGLVIKVKNDGTKGWDKTIVGPNPTEYTDNAFTSMELTNGGIILAGRTSSHDGLTYQVQMQAWLLKMDFSGKQIWSKGYGKNGYYSYNAVSVVQAPDGGYVTAINSNHANSWLLKVDANGNEIKWKEFTKPGVLELAIKNVILNSNGNIVVIGYTRDSYATTWIAEIDSAGNTLWTETYGEANTHIVTNSIEQTKTGYVMAGYRSPNDGSGQQGLLIEVNKNGNEKDREVPSVAGVSSFNSIKKTSDNGYILAGSIGAENSDTWLVKTGKNIRI